VEVPHALGQDEATNRLKQQINQVAGRGGLPVSDLVHQWQDHTLSFSFHAMGMKVAGTLAVEQERVRVDADLPWAAMMVKGMIEKQLREELERVLGSG
jgi:hypothetical protein